MNTGCARGWEADQPSAPFTMNTRPLKFARPLLAVMCCVALAQNRSGSPAIGTTIRTGAGTVSDELFLAEIVNIGLNRLGFKTAPIVQLAYPLLVSAIANGDVDISPSYVEPVFDGFFENAGGESRLQKLGLICTGINGYQIDKRTADRYHITNIQQLQDPKLAAIFDTDGDGKADLIGCDPGWSCELAIQHQMDAYHLRRTVTLKEGNYAALIAETLARYQEGKPVLFYTWYPYWLADVLKEGKDVVWLEVPFTSLPKAMGHITEEETTVNGKNLGLGKGRFRSVGNRKVLEEHPVIQRFLEQLEVSVEDISQESSRIKQGENTPDQIRGHAKEWVRKNEGAFQRWLSAAGGSSDKNAKTPQAPVLKQWESFWGMLNPFRLYTLPLDSAITAAVNSAVRNFRPLFQTFRTPVDWLLQTIRWLLLAAPPVAIVLLAGCATWRIAGRGAGIYSLLSLTLIGFLGLWEAAMVTCAIVVTAVVFCVAAGFPIGVLCARSDRFRKIVRPLLDAMQTLPTLVYLVPVVMLFGIGEVPGVIATIIYALPPVIRFTDLGLRQVSEEVVEAAAAFGSTPGQILWEVQFPLALPTIMAGVSQTVLFALGMTVIASMIAVPGLGLTILQGVGRLDVGTAAVGGLAIVLLAILLDRVTQAIARLTQKLGQ